MSARKNGTEYIVKWPSLGLAVLAVFHFGIEAVAKGTPELVWRDMDQEALDAAYNQRVYAPNLEQVLSRFTTNSDLARDRLGQPRRFEYGTEAREQLDVYPTTVPNAPIMVFIHGGAWRLGSVEQNAFAAEHFVDSGVHFVLPEFSYVQDFDGDLRPIVEQLRRAMVWLYRNASESFDGDETRIFLSGFSSGGHLAAVLLATEWDAYPNIPRDLVKGGLLCSGMYDLYPVSLSYRKEYVKFSPEVIEAFSPMNHIEMINCPVAIAYGTYETPEFQRQAREFYEALVGRGHPVSLLVGENYNHFEIIETMGSPYGLLGRAALEQLSILSEME